MKAGAFSYLKWSAVLAAAVAVVYVTKKTSDAVTATAGAAEDTINYVTGGENENNVIYRGINQVVQDHTKEKDFGQWLYCVTHPKAITCDPNYKPAWRE